MSDEIIEQQPVVIDSPVHGGTDEERGALEVRIVTRDMVPAAPTVERNPDPPDLSANTPKRAFALDALRGLFLISMTFGFTISSQDLPAWMYHRQLGPTDTPVNIAGISWRDLAYASFLFTMAAALPLTLSRKIAKGEPELGIIFAAVRRWAMLLVYGLLVAHGNTYFIGYTNTGRVLALIAFVIMGMIFTRPRKDWDPAKWSQIKKGGWLLAAAFLFLSPLAYGKTFTFTRIDDIMVDLAFASGVGMVLWYFTRNNIPARLAALAVAVGMYVLAKFSGSFEGWWYASPAPWAFQPSRLSLLTVVVPGTVAGDMILRWMNTPSVDTVERSWTSARLGSIIALCCVFTPLVTVAMYNRWVTFAQVASAVMVVAGFFLTRNPSTPTEQMIRRLYLWASLWLLLGLAIEPTEGGIKKEPETLTYFFTVTGTTSMLLVAMTAITDALRKAKWVSLLIDIGHNPLLCYVTFTVLINSALELNPWMRDFMTATPAQSLTRSVASLILTIAIVRYVSRKRIYWRT